MPVLSIVLPFRDTSDVNFALDVTTAINVRQMRQYRLPPLYQSGIRYRGEICMAPSVPGACERFLTALQCLKEKWCDCDDVAPYRAAELICTGEKARAYAIKVDTGWHCLVRREDGTIEDPSRELGMGQS